MIQSVTCWWIVYFPKRLPDLRGAIFCSRHDFGLCERGGSTCWRTWCSCLMQISPLWHDGADKSFQSNWSNRLDWDGLYFTATVQRMQQQDYISQLDPTRKLLHVVLPFDATMFLLSSISSRVPASQLCLMASVSERSSRVAFWRWHRYIRFIQAVKYLGHLIVHVLFLWISNEICISGHKEFKAILLWKIGPLSFAGTEMFCLFSLNLSCLCITEM